MSRERILVVDDDAVIRGLLKDSLCLHELEVASASDGAMALEMATQEEHAVAIVDLEMPGMSGTEVIRRLKKLRPHTEVIIFTGNPSFESSIDAIHQQVFDYVCKPADMRAMLKTVRKALEHRRLILENQDLLAQLEVERNQLQQEVNAARRALEQRFRGGG
jgi:two-component system response regulator HydG